MEEWKELRIGAQNIVDKIHDFEPHIIVITGRSTRPALTLVAEAWKRRFPGKKWPRVKHINHLEKGDVEGKRVALFDEVVVSGDTMRNAARMVAVHSPKRTKLLALMQGDPTYLPPGIEAGTAYQSGFKEALGIGLRSQLRREYANLKTRNQYGEYWKSEMRKSARNIRETQTFLRLIASKIEPR